MELAEEALIDAHARYDYGKTTGPLNVYKCEECGFFHLTSQGAMNERLAEYLKSGRAKIDKEATKWKDKWKRR